MEVSGAARAPPHLTFAAPTTEYFQSTAILGTTTARSKLFGRCGRKVLDCAPPLSPPSARTAYIVVISFLQCPPALPRAHAPTHPAHVRAPRPPIPPLPSPEPALQPPSSLARHARCQSQPRPSHGWPRAYVPYSPPPSSPPRHLLLSSRSLLSNPMRQGYVTLHLPSPECPSFASQQLSARRKAMAPAYPDARKGSCQNGLSFNRSHPMLANCPPSVTRVSTYRPYIASQMCFLLTTHAPHFTDQPRDQLSHRARSSEVRAA